VEQDAVLRAGARSRLKEEWMSEAKEMRSGTFRCPVCGHSDSTDLVEGEESLMISCSYCDTLLEVTVRGPDSIRLQAQVAEEAGD
jgi:transcription elongation factor Elf1